MNYKWIKILGVIGFIIGLVQSLDATFGFISFAISFAVSNTHYAKRNKECACAT
jgi:hypothetical protein